jgi:hypothetical protein
MGSRTNTAMLVTLSLFLAQACSSSSSSHGNKSGAGTPIPTSNASQAEPDASPSPTRPTVALDECGLKTQWAGDQYCILPPPPDKGFQIHIGPTNYDNPESQYLMQPGEETVENFPVTSGNTSDVYYYFRQYRMRPGSHHLIVYSGSGGGKRLGGSQNMAKDNPEGGVIAPENQGVGMPLAANTPLTINLHYINSTNHPIIKEAWVNFWYRDPSAVTEPANEVFSPTPMNVAPGQHVVIHGSCPVSGSGHALNLYGHRHANNLRFSIWRERGSQKDLVYEDYDWEHPLVLEYSSLLTNTPAIPASSVGGGWSGILDLQDGDNLSFECEIRNMTDKTFVGKNEAKTDEMCIMVGDTVGATVPPFCTTTTTAVP